ncbi:hypothetical protein K8R30_04805 [archaeon]|nr:hypothetical protein [archaeon]
MENISEDIGEKVIAQLKELIEMLERKFKKNNNEPLFLCNHGNKQDN